MSTLRWTLHHSNGFCNQVSLSVPKLANILKKIEEVSHLIVESDPNGKRSAKVKQSLQNAVKCYKVIHDDKDSRRKLSDFLGER